MTLSRLKSRTRRMIATAKRRKEYPADERKHVAGELRWHRKNRGKASAKQEFDRA